MSKPRILFICHGHPELVPGGTELFAYDLFREIRAGGRMQAMFLGCVSRLHRAARSSTRFQTIGRSADELLLWVGGFDRLMLSQTHAGTFAESLTEFLGSFKPDIVHFHHFSLIGLEALVLIKRVLPQVRIVVTLHDYHLICANDGLMTTTPTGAPCHKASPDACHRCFPEIAPGRFLARALHVRNLLGLVDRFIAPSRFLYDRYVEWGLPPSRIDRIRNAVPDAEPVAKCAGNRPKHVFGFFGNVSPHKGVLVLLAAAKRLVEAEVDATLHIHGGIRFQSAEFCRSFDVALGDAYPIVCHQGPYHRQELPGLLAQVDWVIVPSTWWENAPLIILEAFRHRRPVICADIGGMAEMVQDGVNGLHFRAGDPGDLARVMRRACEEPSLWERLSSAAPHVPDLVEAAERHLTLYASLMGEKEALSA